MLVPRLEMDKQVEELLKQADELMKEAGIAELKCRPDPQTGELVCALTEAQAAALKEVGFEPKRVVYEIQSSGGPSELTAEPTDEPSN